MTHAARAAWAATSRVLGAVVGGFAVALSGTICLALCVLDSAGLGFALGMTFVLPAWIAAMCALLLGQTARRVWLLSSALTGAFVLAAVVVAWARARAG